MTKFIQEFSNQFQVDVLEKLSLPSVSEMILWKMYDRENFPKIFSFSPKFGDVNEMIRKHILGGPSIGK